MSRAQEPSKKYNTFHPAFVSASKLWPLTEPYTADAGLSLTAIGFLTSTGAYATYLARIWQVCTRGKVQSGRLLTLSTGAAATTFLLWTLALWRAADGRGEGFGPALKFWWLPLGPSLLVLLLEQVWAMFAGSSKDLEALKSSMYNFKSA